MRRGHDWPGFLVTALFGGVWGALLARVVAQTWPLGPAAAHTATYGAAHRALCLLLTPLPTILLGFGGAAGALLLCCRRRCGFSGWAAAARSWPLALSILNLAQPFFVPSVVASPLWGVGSLVAGLGGVLWLRGWALRLKQAAAWPVELAWDFAVFVLSLALYAGTLAPSVLPGDSGEFQFVAPMLGIPHPTGYPLYLLLGKLISLVPLNSVAYRLNLLSALAGAGAVWAVYRCGRALGLHRSAALLGGSLLALSETFWSQATIAEKYTLNAFFVALTLWLGLQWAQEARGRERLAGRSRASFSRAGWLLSAWAFCYGLSLAHHRTMLLLAPVYLYLVWVTDRRALLRSALRLALLALAPITLYLLLPWFSARHPPYAYIRLDSVHAFLDLVLARDYQGVLFSGGWAALPGRVTEWGRAGQCVRLLVRQFGAAGLAAAAIGWFLLYRRKRHVAWVLIAGIGVQVLFALNYYVPNTAVYYLPAYVWLAVCAAAAVDAVVAAQPDEASEPGRRFFAALRMTAWPVWRHLTLACILALSIWPMVLLTTRLPGMNQGRAYSRLAFDHTYGQLAARYTEPGALIASDWLPATVLWYTQWVEGQMPSVQVAVVDPLEGQWAGLVESALAGGRAAYLARPLAAAGDDHPLTSAGPLVRVLDAPATSVPFMSHPASEQAVFGGDVRLLGADLLASAPGAEGTVYVPSGGWESGGWESGRTPSHSTVQGGSTLHVTLYWQALRPPAGDYGVTVRLVNVDPDRGAAGHNWLERSNRHPVGGSYPTSRWQAGEVVGDFYELALPPFLPSGDYQLLVSMDAPSGAPRVAALPPFSIHKPLRWQNSSPEVPVRKLLNRELALVGYDAPQQLVPGERASIALQWLVCGRTVPRSADIRFRPRLVLISRSGTETLLAPLANSPGDWLPGALVVDPYAFSVPGDLARVEVRSVEADGMRHRLPLRVASEPPSGAIFGAGQLGAVVRLRGHSYGARSVKPGGTVLLTLEWEAMRRMDEAYKVFVHVLGPNGLPVAQQDNEPLNGAYPTTRWQPGERVSDPYAIRLPDDLPPGEYPVEVGLYRISDLSRLSVLDRDQLVVDDKVFLTPITIR